MTFESAIGSLSDGKAAKRQAWGGYVKREDGYLYNSGSPAAVQDFSTESTYAVGAVVKYSGSYYICKSAVSTAGAWDSTKWASCSAYKLVFRKRANVDSSPVDVPYYYTPSWDSTNSAVAYAFEPDGSPSSEESSMLKLDGTLLDGMIATDWITGTTTAFEAARTGSAIW